MSVWDEVKRSVDDISEVAREVANLLAEKTDEISREGRIKLEIFNLQRQVRSRESKLGRRAFELWVENADGDIGKDPAALEHLEAMKGLVAEIRARSGDLASSGGAGEGKDAPEDGKKASD